MSEDTLPTTEDMAQDALRFLHEIVRDPEAEASDRLDAARTLLKAAGMGEKAGGEGIQGLALQVTMLEARPYVSPLRARVEADGKAVGDPRMNDAPDSEVPVAPGSETGITEVEDRE